MTIPRVLVLLAGPVADDGEALRAGLAAEADVLVLAVGAPASSSSASPSAGRLAVPDDLDVGEARKVGLRYALDEGYALAVTVPGGAGEGVGSTTVRALIEAWRREDADLVVATRPGRRWVDASFGRLAGAALPDPRSALRAYSERLLRRVPFEIADPGPRFDLDLLLQAHLVGARIAGVEAPSVPATGVGALATLAVGLRFALHRHGMACSLRYRDLEAVRYRDKTAMLYTSHHLAIDAVAAAGARRVVDLGCGPGFVARELERRGIEVTGVDVHEPLPGTMRRFVRARLGDEPLPFDPFDADAVLLLDVVEHLVEPERFLVELRNRSRAPDPPLVVLSTPNVAFAAVRLNLLLGRFRYAERGILDVSHVRLFTRSSLLAMLADCGYRLERVVPVPVPFEMVVGGRLGRLLGAVAAVLARVLPGLFAFQLLACCRPLPSVGQLLAAARPPAAAESVAG